MSYKLSITPAFIKALKPLLKKYKSLKNDLKELFESIEENPIQGSYLGHDCYKIRLAITSKHKGKSGGARVITCVKISAENVFLLTIYDKSDIESISDKEINELLGLL